MKTHRKCGWHKAGMDCERLHLDLTLRCQETVEGFKHLKLLNDALRFCILNKHHFSSCVGEELKSKARVLESDLVATDKQC